MMFIGPRTFVRFNEDSNLASYGTNCDVGPSEMVDTVLLKKTKYRSTYYCKSKLWHFFLLRRIVYSGTPEKMSRYALLVFKARAKIIGSCCGTTPLHIEAMRNSFEKAPNSASYSAVKHF